MSMEACCCMQLDLIVEMVQNLRIFNCFFIPSTHDTFFDVDVKDKIPDAYTLLFPPFCAIQLSY